LLLAAKLIPRRRRPRLVWLNMTLTNLLRRPRRHSGLLSLAIAGADRVVCVARQQQAFLRQRYRWPASRLPLALSGTDAAFYTSDRARPVQPGTAVLAPGRDAGRDYATLVEALREGPDLRLVCSPPNLARITLPPNATVRYDIPPDALREEYGAAPAVAIPTLGDESTAGSDCSGTLVLLDALAMGRPAVITERASVRDYVTPGRHALAVPPGQPAPLRRAVDRLLTDRDAAGEMAAAGKTHVLDGLTTRHFARRIAAVLHEAAAAPRGGA
jgi:hypothetical protein